MHLQANFHVLHLLAGQWYSQEFPNVLVISLFLPVRTHVAPSPKKVSSELTLAIFP